MPREQYADLDFKDASRILNLPAPASDNEPARKSDLDAAVAGLGWKDNCRVATQGNINLAAPGASLDGIALAAADRVLVRNQTAPAENGIYLFTAAATPMTRAPDAATAAALESAVAGIDEGTDAGTSWRQSAVNFTLDTDTVTWGSFGTGAPAATETTAGIAELATQAEVDAGSDDQRTITALKLANWSGRKRKATADIGDNAATQFDLTHNWGTSDVLVQVRRAAAPFDNIGCDIERPDVNTVRLKFTTAPTVNQFRVLVLG